MRGQYARLLPLLALCLAGALKPAPLLAQGAWLSAAGPVNRGMAGASVAAPLDAIGATYWNPATISGLECSELGFGLDLLYSNHTIESQFGPLAGATESENGFFPIPSVGWVHHVPDSPVSLGLFVGGVAGFKTTVNADPTNPILGMLGRISSEATFMQLAPSVSVAVNERLALAAGPVVTLGQVGVEPFVFDTPNGGGQYPSGRATRYHWGGGAQIGAYYMLGNIHLGASLKSPSWMERFRFFGENGASAGRVMHAELDLPMILSVGTAYTGFERWELAMDVRYLDYANTAGFGDPAMFDAEGRAQGLGWRSVVAVAAGAQFRLAECLYLRGGYTFNQNPIGSPDTMFNLAAPLFYEHMASAGATWLLGNAAFTLAYSYYFPSDVSGPLVVPGLGPVPGTSVSQTVDAHMLNFGVSVRY